MGRFVCLSLAASGFALAAPAMVSAEAVEIAPSTPWNVDFGEEQCRLGRLFGEGEERHALFLEQYWPGEKFGLTAGGPAFDRFRSGRRTYLQFFEAQEPLRTEPFAGSLGQVGDAVIYSSVDLETGTQSDGDDSPARSLPALDTAFAGKVEFVSLRQSGKEVRLLTGPLDEAFEVLNTCTSSLAKSWGVDVERHLSATRLPVWTNRGEIVRRIQSDYPPRALRRGEQAIMRMRVMIDETGAVEDCAILKSTDTEYLESGACEAVRHAEFEPALDASGAPMRSYHVESIVYQMAR